MHRVARIPRLGLRTLRAFVPVLAVPDDAFASTFLDGQLLALYQRMDRRDRVHAVEVAKRLLHIEPQAERLLVQAALLHDLGKTVAPYMAWERVMVHLWTPDAQAALRFPARLQEAWRRHRRHPEVGADALLAIRADPRLVALVAGHHRSPGDDRGAQLLRLADEGH